MKTPQKVVEDLKKKYKPEEVLIILQNLVEELTQKNDKLKREIELLKLKIPSPHKPLPKVQIDKSPTRTPHLYTPESLVPDQEVIFDLESGPLVGAMKGTFIFFALDKTTDTDSWEIPRPFNDHFTAVAGLSKSLSNNPAGFMKLAQAAYGYSDNSRSIEDRAALGHSRAWPVCREGDTAGLSRFINAINKVLCGKLTLDAAIEQCKKETGEQ